MTKDEKISNFERVLSWLPEAFKSWATSNPFLSSTLNEVLNERDTRLSGTPCTSRLKTAVTALLQKLQDRRDKSAALILAASREAEETAFTLASRMSEGTGLRIAATTGVRDGAGLAAIFATAPDLVVTNPKVLKKVFDKGFVAPEAFRTILVDGAEWHDVMGDTDLIASLVERFPAALQLIVTGPIVVETTEDPYNAMLHAPAYCRAPDEAAREAAPKERVVLVPEEKMSETLAREAEKTPVLFLVSTPTESTRVTGLLKEAGIAAKRATATQSASARETLVLKFIAGRVEHLVMPHSVIGELEHNRASRVILTDLSGGPEPYLEHLALTADGTGELVTIVTPETLPLFEKLLIAAEKRLTLENPYNLPEPRTVIGQLLRREKLTIRTKYGRTAESTEGDRGEQDDRGEGRSRWERRKSKNGQRKDRKDGFRKDRKDFRKDEQGKTFGKKPRKAAKPHRDEALPVEAAAPEADAVMQPQAAPAEGAASEQAQTRKPRKSFTERRFGKNRPFKQRQEDAAETSSAPVEAQAESTEGDRGEQDDRGEGRSRWERRKSKNGQRKDRKDGFRKDRKDFRKDEQGKTFGKKPRKAAKPHRDEALPVEAAAPEADAVMQPQAAPAEGAASEQAQTRKPRKSFTERRFGKNRPFKQRQEDAAETSSAPVEAQAVPAAEAGAQDKSRKDHFKNFRRKSRKFQNGEGEASRTQEKPVQNAGSEQAAAGDRKPQEKKTFEKKAFEKKPYEKKPFEKKRDRKKPARQDAEAKPRQQDWDDDNFGNSIHYQPKRQNLRGLPSDQQIHWEPTDPYHPSSQALSLPQIMPDENRRGGYVNGNVNGNVKGGFNRSRRNYRKKREG